MSTRILALHRDQDVVCASCGRTVTRKSRQQRYCSIRCKEKRRGRVRKAFLGVDTRATANPPKKAHVSNELQAPESQSRLINNAAQIEFFGGGHWQQVVSPDGIATHVTRLWPRKVLLSPTAAAAMARAGSAPSTRGEIEGKRSGMTQNINRAARERWLMQRVADARKDAA
jgi:hypothetical protein